MAESQIFAFVLMPFSQEFTDIYKFGIKEPAKGLGITAERVDEQIYQEGILERIYRQIELADIIIADMSNQNPNVFYEVGYAHAKNKICILMTSNPDDIPFDLKHRRHIVYNSIDILRKNIIEELLWAKKEIENINKSHIKVSLQNISGTLEKTKFSAVGHVDFEIDLLNDTGAPSAEIEAVYFYSRKAWKLYQDGKECSSTKSDIDGYDKRHFLTPPLHRLHKESWAQLKFKAKKYLAWAMAGEEMKDSYRVAGRSNLRLVTSEGNLDYELNLDVTIEEVPF